MSTNYATVRQSVFIYLVVAYTKQTRNNLYVNLRLILTDVFTGEGDAGVHRHIQRRGRRPGVQPDEPICIPRGKRQPQHRPVHRGRPAHTQRMVLEMYDRPSAPLELKIRMLRAEVLETMLYGYVT